MTRMMKTEMPKRQIYQNMRDAVLFYGGQQIFYVKRILHWSPAELLGWVLREDQATQGFPHNTHDELWEVMVGETWQWEFCCKVARLEDRQWHLCHNNVVARVRKAVDKEKQTLANAEERHRAGGRGPAGHPAWLPTSQEKENADSEVDRAIHEEAAELVKEGTACLQAINIAGQSQVNSEGGDTAAKVLTGIRNLSEKVRLREAERKRELEVKIKHQEAEIRQKVRELHIAAKEVKEFQEQSKSVSSSKTSNGRFREFGAEKGGIGNGSESGKRGLPSNHEPGVHPWVDDAGKRGHGDVGDDSTLNNVEMSTEEGVLQEMEEYDDVPELCTSFMGILLSTGVEKLSATSC